MDSIRSASFRPSTSRYTHLLQALDQRKAPPRQLVPKNSYNSAYLILYPIIRLSLRQSDTTVGQFKKLLKTHLFS